MALVGASRWRFQLRRCETVVPAFWKDGMEADQERYRTTSVGVGDVQKRCRQRRATQPSNRRQKAVGSAIRSLRRCLQSFYKGRSVRLGTAHKAYKEMSPLWKRLRRRKVCHSPREKNILCKERHSERSPLKCFTTVIRVASFDVTPTSIWNNSS